MLKTIYMPIFIHAIRGQWFHWWNLGPLMKRIYPSTPFQARFVGWPLKTFLLTISTVSTLEIMADAKTKNRPGRSMTVWFTAWCLVFEKMYSCDANFTTILIKGQCSWHLFSWALLELALCFSLSHCSPLYIGYWTPITGTTNDVFPIDLKGP